MPPNQSDYGIPLRHKLENLLIRDEDWRMIEHYAKTCECSFQEAFDDIMDIAKGET